MSTSFDVFPTSNYIPKYDEVINIAQNMFYDFMKKARIEKEILLHMRCIRKNVCKKIFLN